MTAASHRDPTDAILFRLGDGLLHAPVGGDMSHGSVSFQESDGALILDSRKLTLFADISFLKPQDIDRQAGDAVGFDAPKV